MVKSYLNLNEIEKNEICKFINRNLEIKKSIKEVENECNNRANGYGEGSLLYFKDESVIGKITIILEACEKLGIIYICSLEIADNLKVKEEVIKSLIKEGINVSKMYKPRVIKLGIKQEEVLKVLEKLGFRKEYGAYLMSLEDYEKREESLELIQLSNENKDEYFKIINESFTDMPHACYTEASDVEEYLNKSNEESYYFMVSKYNTIIGFLNCEIEGKRGQFDIGLCKNYRGQGYGKVLLETAINFLKQKKVENIELVVIEKNNIAFEMYKKRGFKIKTLLSYWMTL